MEDTVFLGADMGTYDCGYRPHHTAPLREDDLQGQLALFASFEKRGYEGIILWPIHAQAFRNPVERAVSRGLPVVVLGSELGIKSDNLAYVLNDEDAGVKLAADRLNEVVKGHGSVVINGIDVSSSTSMRRLSALRQYIATRYPSIHLQESPQAGTQVADQEQVTQQLLRKTPNIDAFVALDAASTRGTYYAIIREALPKHISLIGFDQELLPTNGNLLIDGVVAQRTREMGEIAAQSICNRLAGKPMSPRTLLQPFLITPANFNTPEIENELSGKWLKFRERGR